MPARAGLHSRLGQHGDFGGGGLGVDEIESNPDRAALTESKALRCGIGQIDHPRLDHRSAVVHPKHQGTMVAQIRDPHKGPKGRVRCAQVIAFMS